ncbi:hypothetical protein AWENTII_010710 [Aspergillus wentii]
MYSVKQIKYRQHVFSREARSIGALGTMVRAVGGWTKPSGRGLYMFRSLITGSCCAALFGLCGAGLLGYTIGAGGIGFAGGSCVGFIAGTITYFMDCRRQSLLALARYPELMRLHLFINYPSRDYRMPFANDEMDLEMKGMLISAWHSAATTIEEIQYDEERRIVAGYSKEMERIHQEKDST